MRRWSLREAGVKDRATDKDRHDVRGGITTYKVHVRKWADTEGGVDPANINDTEVADELIMGDEGAVR